MRDMLRRCLRWFGAVAVAPSEDAMVCGEVFVGPLVRGAVAVKPLVAGEVVVSSLARGRVEVGECD